MAEFKLTIADELLPTIADLGYDANSYFDEVFTKPLLQRHRLSLEQVVLEGVKTEIDQQIETMKASVSFTLQPVQAVDTTPQPVDPPVVETVAATPPAT